MNTRLVSRHDDFDGLIKFLEMLFVDGLLCQSFYGGSVRREDGMFEDMEEELKWFDEPPSFSDHCVRLKGKFSDDFTLKGRI